MSGEVSGEGVQMSITNHYQNYHSQYCTTHTCLFWAKNEAVDSHTLALKYSIDKIKSFEYF